ncbi:MAG: hypothetical protein LLG37_03140 [Spirochaetia bacterium]|nr:hypothetical protein [Spirochaetia bacterium]
MGKSDFLKSKKWSFVMTGILSFILPLFMTARVLAADEGWNGVLVFSAEEITALKELKKSDPAGYKKFLENKTAEAVKKMNELKLTDPEAYSKIVAAGRERIIKKISGGKSAAVAGVADFQERINARIKVTMEKMKTHDEIEKNPDDNKEKIREKLKLKEEINSRLKERNAGKRRERQSR